MVTCEKGREGGIGDTVMDYYLFTRHFGDFEFLLYTYLALETL